MGKRRHRAGHGGRHRHDAGFLDQRRHPRHGEVHGPAVGLLDAGERGDHGARGRRGARRPRPPDRARPRWRRRPRGRGRRRRRPASRGLHRPGSTARQPESRRGARRRDARSSPPPGPPMASSRSESSSAVAGAVPGPAAHTTIWPAVPTTPGAGPRPPGPRPRWQRWGHRSWRAGRRRPRAGPTQPRSRPRPGCVRDPSADEPSRGGPRRPRGGPRRRQRHRRGSASSRASCSGVALPSAAAQAAASSASAVVRHRWPGAPAPWSFDHPISGPSALGVRVGWPRTGQLPQLRQEGRRARSGCTPIGDHLTGRQAVRLPRKRHRRTSWRRSRRAHPNEATGTTSADGVAIASIGE